MDSKIIGAAEISSGDFDRSIALTAGAETTSEQQHKAALTVVSRLPKDAAAEVLAMLGLIEPKPSDEYVHISKGRVLVESTRVARARCPVCEYVKPLTADNKLINHKGRIVNVPCESIGKQAEGDIFLSQAETIRHRGKCQTCNQTTWLDSLGLMGTHRPSKRAKKDCAGTRSLPVDGSEFEHRSGQYRSARCPSCMKAIKIDGLDQYIKHDRRLKDTHCPGTGRAIRVGTHDYHVLERRRVRCHDCTRRIAILTDGTFPLHTIKDKGTTRCWGSGKDAGV